MHSSQLPLARPRAASPWEIEKPQPQPGSLEASLLQLMHEHHQKSRLLRENTEKAKKDATLKAVNVAKLLMDAVNGGVQECYINEKRIELEIRALAATISRFMGQTNQWLTATHAINSAIKEIGDFENWMKTMEFDCKNINAAICNIHQ
ncbi:Biogenesis of lysosome-related organelles complex 1 subunit 1 [Euphorbia peplus]|nr:Biogenesis of lysosome-related organelles complex 1 subunit 1 [Euphorbia peplus]